MGRVARLAAGVLCCAAVCAALVASATSAEAARPPTLKEREAITTALPAYFLAYPIGCVYVDVSVSSSGRYAMVGPVVFHPFRSPCSRYAANGFWILKRLVRWKIVFDGSEPPPCSLHVPRDLYKECFR